MPCSCGSSNCSHNNNHYPGAIYRSLGGRKSFLGMVQLRPSGQLLKLDDPRHDLSGNKIPGHIMSVTECLWVLTRYSPCAWFPLLLTWTYLPNEIQLRVESLWWYSLRQIPHRFLHSLNRSLACWLLRKKEGQQHQQHILPFLYKLETALQEEQATTNPIRWYRHCSIQQTIQAVKWFHHCPKRDSPGLCVVAK